MKKIMPFLLAITLFGGCQDFPEGGIETEDKADIIMTRSSGSGDYYYGSAGRIPIVRSSDKFYVLFEADAINLQKSLLGEDMANSHDAQDYNIVVVPGGEKVPNMFTNLKSSVGKAGDIASLIKLEEVVYAAPYYTFENGKEFPLTNLFYVELKKAEDIDVLTKLATENNVAVISRIPLTETAYTLGCTKNSAGNALEMANLFYETGLFLSAAPEFMSVEFESPNDTYFSDQWGLKNTGQCGGTVGIDLNFDNARLLSTGSSNITIAVIDHGVPVNHPDLTVTYAHDAITQTNTTTLYGNHGTAVAGIIGARTNNGVGIAGIAPGCKLMSISTNFSTASLAYALRYAANNGAAVINNSWGGPADMPVVNSAIRHALQNGRGGKGCVVVFSAGNDNNPDVNYPKASDRDLLVVGAISFNGMRKSPSTPDGETWWGSNYGSAVDVVAPGVNIYTTDRQGDAGYNSDTSPFDLSDRDYTMRFNGTSAACPQVAGVAALILSLNPSLTQRQVSDIIESTAKKVGGYGYATTPGRYNGTWDSQMGYGLVDAFKALTAHLAISGVDVPPLNSNVTYSVTAPPPGMTFVNWTITGGAYTTPNGVSSRNLTVNFSSLTGYTLTANFTIPGGAPYSVSKSVHLVPPTPTVSHYPEEIRSGQSVQFYISSPIEGATYEWFLISGSSRYGTGTSFWVTADNYTYPTTIAVYCRVIFNGVTSAHGVGIVNVKPY